MPGTLCPWKCWCCGDDTETPVPCYRYSWAVSNADGKGYVWAGTPGPYYDPELGGDNPPEASDSIGCSRVLIWEGRMLSTGSPLTFGGSDDADHIVRTFGRHAKITPDGFNPYPDPPYALGGDRDEGPFLTSKPDYWPCLWVSGIAGASLWCTQPTLSDVMAALKGTLGAQGAAPWWTSSTPLEIGRRHDIALSIALRKRCIGYGPIRPAPYFTGQRIYESESDGVAYLEAISVAPSAFNPL